ncbi:MAG: DUF6434 domain-containing protein [Pseudomonadota bacterium]
MTETRPRIDQITTGAELKRWYWLRAELSDHARTLGLSQAGVKFEILDRIAHFLDTGQRQAPKRVKRTSAFDWHSAILTDDTPLTDSYKNTQNVRRYFTARIGPSFAFNIEFMAWLRANTGKTLADACAEYRAIAARTAANGGKTKIAPGNQFNQYTRDFLADNPQADMDDVRRVWALKRARPSATGRHVYDPSDCHLT